MILQQLRPRKLHSKAKFYAPISKTQIFKDVGLFALEKGATSGGATTLLDITKALNEYKRLFKAGISSNAEKLTLARAFPDNSIYVEAAALIPDSETMVIGGPASVELIDREGHMITNNALSKAFEKYMDNFRTRNAMVLHSDVQVGWALPAYITRGGQIFKSGVGEGGLFFICELRGDTKISEKVAQQIEEGKLRSYSIAGSATKVQQMQKGLMPYMQVDEMELAEVTVCEKGVNQGAGFEILKAEDKNPDFPDEDEAVLIVDPVEVKPEPVSHVSISINLLEKEDGDIDFTNTFFNYVDKESKMAVTSPDSPKIPTKPPRKTGRGRPSETNGHYPDKKIPNQTNKFLEYMEKGIRGPGKKGLEAAKERLKGDIPPTFYNDPYLDNPVESRPVSTVSERRRKNINIPTWADRDEDYSEMRATMQETPFNAPTGLDPNVLRRMKRHKFLQPLDNFLNHMEKTKTTLENKPRGVGKSKRTVHPTDTD